MTSLSEFKRTLDRALQRHDRLEALTLAHGALDDGIVELTQLYDILGQMLADVGAGWQAGTVEVWQEHLATGIIRTIVESCAWRVADASPKAPEASVVLAAPDQEYHDLGLRMLADRFTLAGWRAHFLGANVPAWQVASAVHDLGAQAVALSASTHFHRVRLGTYVATLQQQLPTVQIWIGGAAFTHGQDDRTAALALDPREIPPGGGH